MQTGNKYIHAIIGPDIAAYMEVGETLSLCIAELENSMDSPYTGPLDSIAGINKWLHANGYPNWYILENSEI